MEARIGILSRGDCIQGIICTRVWSLKEQEGNVGVASILVTARSSYYPQSWESKREEAIRTLEFMGGPHVTHSSPLRGDDMSGAGMPKESRGSQSLGVSRNWRTGQKYLPFLLPSNLLSVLPLENLTERRCQGSLENVVRKIPAPASQSRS